MSKLHNFVADKLQNPELVEGARRRGRSEGPHSPFNDNPYYTPKFEHDAAREGRRVAAKAERRRDHAIAKQNRIAAREARKAAKRGRYH